MEEEKELTEQEKRYLDALKLFLEASDDGDPKHRTATEILDELSPEQQRAIIRLYHLLGLGIFSDTFFAKKRTDKPIGKRGAS